MATEERRSWQTVPGNALPFSCALNFRELGGYRAADGRAVRWGMFFRTGQLIEIVTQQDRELFDSLGVRTILDLRSQFERDRLPDPIFSGAAYFPVSAIVTAGGTELQFNPNSLQHLMQVAQSMADGDPTMDNIYRELPFDNKAYRLLFEQAMAGNAPILFHCSAGKDRTGVAAALLLLALGIPRETVIQDYLLTNIHRKPAIDEFLSFYTQKIKEEPRLAPVLRSVQGVSRRGIELALDTVRQRYPDITDYFREEYGLNAADLATLRDRYLE